MYANFGKFRRLCSLEIENIVRVLSDFSHMGGFHDTFLISTGLFSFWSQPESHGKARICEFIDKSVQNSRDGRFLYFLRPSARGVPPLPIRLLNPVSRNFRVASLKHLSRYIIVFDMGVVFLYVCLC